VGLLDQSQLDYYAGLDGGLLGCYRRRGFEVLHHPIADHMCCSPGLVLPAIRADCLAAKKPVLNYCSAEIDRTGVVVDYIRTALVVR